MKFLNKCEKVITIIIYTSLFWVLAFGLCNALNKEKQNDDEITTALSGVQEEVYNIHNDLKTYYELTRSLRIDFNDLANKIYIEQSKVNQEASKSFVEDNAINLGQFITTAYCPCKKCCGNYSYEVTGKINTTASGTNPKSSHTIAADISILPFGTEVLIDGIIYTVEDTGSGVKGKHIDIYFDNHNEAVNYGKQTSTVYRINKKD